MSELVVLLRSPDDPDRYEEILRADGFASRSVPVLIFKTVNERQLREALETPNSYDGLIFTSPRAVDAFADAMSWLPSENVRWHGKPIFAVGPRTGDDLRTIGFEPQGEESGSAEMLVEHIKKQSFERPLLFLCGDRRRDTLPDGLQAAGVELEELCVYESQTRRHVEWPVERPDWIVFFSPSGVESLRESGVDVAGIRVAAIGPTTADAVRAEGVSVDAIAEEPSPEAVAAAIRRAHRG